ncbi:MAG TPA: ArdC-like ssDNA-binding domain-containing protein [Blastocatellia bacterium]|nr:ArdC-like ssDNA-binding domain-containing protein [Blastocatellia bacterium]
MSYESNNDSTKWTELLTEAVTKPGMISKAYRSFHGYSIGNQMLALLQCQIRGLEPGPISTYPGWQAKGRQVKRGERAIVLCMPLTSKRKAEDQGDEDAVFVRFIYRANWFVLCQTEGETVEILMVPDWDRSKALTTLAISEVPFEHMDGNCMGYARRRDIAINPLNPLPHKTTFHELAHCLLGHTSESELSDTERTPRSLREVEAESVALICCESLGLPGAEYSRGYIQGWIEGDVIPERSAQKIFHAADQILKAGQIADASEIH